MNILVGLDYGKVRCGIAISDPNHIIASPHKTVNNNLLIDSLVEINNEYVISKLIVGLPKKMNNQIFDLEHEIQSVIKRIKKSIPSIIIERVDERFTSKISKYFLNASSQKQKNRRNKENLDKISASLILQTYIDQK